MVREYFSQVSRHVPSAKIETEELLVAEQAGERI
jgi:hypothetical protein